MKSKLKYLFIIQARLNSSRYPNKVLTNIYKDFTLIDIVIERLLNSEHINKNNLYILTSNSNQDAKLVKYLNEKGYSCFVGDEKNVYDRYYKFLKSFNGKCNYFFRICSDNPCIMPEFIDQIIDFNEKNSTNYDYISYKDYKNIPSILTHSGLFSEMIKYDTFLNANYILSNDDEKEHVTPIFYKKDIYNCYFIDMPEILNDFTLRTTFDTDIDLSIIKKVYNKIDSVNFSFLDLINLLKDNKEILLHMNKNIISNLKGSFYVK